MRRDASDSFVLQPVDADRFVRQVQARKRGEERAEASVETAPDLDEAFCEELHRRAQSAIATGYKEALAIIESNSDRAMGAAEDADFSLGRNEVEALQQEVREAVRHDEAELSHHFRDYEGALSEIEEFKAARRLRRAATRSQPFASVVAFVILIVTVEAAFNAVFLMPSDPFGYASGAISAVLVSLFNVLVAYLLGWFLVKRINSKFMLQKLVGGSSLLFAVVLLMALHYFVARYRGHSERLSEDASAALDLTRADLLEGTWSSITANPFAFDDFASLFLLGFGLLLGFIALFKGFTLGDRYPGFTARQAQFDEAFGVFNAYHSGTMDEFSDRREAVVGAITSFLNGANTAPTLAQRYLAQSDQVIASIDAFRRSLDVAVKAAVREYADDLPRRERRVLENRTDAGIETALTQFDELSDRTSSTRRSVQERMDRLAEGKALANRLRGETIEEIDGVIKAFEEKYDARKA